MDTAQITAFAAAIAALPFNAFLVLLIVFLWRRLNAVTDLLIEAKAAKVDSGDKLVNNPSGAAPPY